MVLLLARRAAAMQEQAPYVGEATSEDDRVAGGTLAREE
jgi:hypothetical protein